MGTRANRDGTSPFHPDRPRDDRADPRSDRSRSLGDLLLRTPLFHRILLGNAVVVALGAVVGTAVSVHMGRSWTGTSTLALAAGFAAVGLVLSVVVNGILVRRLLDPLERLERAAGRIQDGADPGGEEVAVPPTVDPGLRRLVRVFNGMLRALSRQRARLREMAVRSLQATEEERDRISGILQEDTAQRVASCLIRLQWARGLEGPERDRALDHLRGEMGDVLESIRGLARSLRAPELDDIGLESALRALARETRKRWGTEVRLTLPEVPPVLDPEDRLTLYRAVEAILRSWVQEGRARGAVRVSLDRSNGAVVAEIAYGPRPLPAPVTGDVDPGPALFALRERARSSGGEIDLMRGPDEAARAVRIRLPVSEARSASVPPSRPGVPDTRPPTETRQPEGESP